MFIFCVGGGWELAGQDTAAQGISPVYHLVGLSWHWLTPGVTTWPTHQLHQHQVVRMELGLGWGGLLQDWCILTGHFWEARIACACRMLGCSQCSQCLEKHVLGPVMSTSLTSLDKSKRRYPLCDSEHAFQGLRGHCTDSSCCLQLGYVGMQFMSKATRNPHEIRSVVFWKWTAALTQPGRNPEWYGDGWKLGCAERKESKTSGAIEITDSLKYSSCLITGTLFFQRAVRPEERSRSTAAGYGPGPKAGFIKV